LHGRGARRNAFRSPRDVAHAVLGFVVGAVRVYVPFGRLVALAASVAYIAYESVEAEPPSESYHNIIEFITGYMLAAILFS
jgi:hypothetical protein